MGKIEVRIDDRLIHGQTIVAWCPHLGIEEIIAVDDISASNPMLKSIMTMGVPKLYTTNIVTVKEARELLGQKSDKKRMVIVKSPAVLMELGDVVAQAGTIVLGNLAKKEDSVHHIGSGTEIYFLSRQDVVDLQSFVDAGMEVKFQQLPAGTATSWDGFLKLIR